MLTLEDAQATRFYRIRRTLMQMLNDRGYMVTDSEINITMTEFIAKFGKDIKRGEDLTIHKTKRNDNKDQIYVFFPENAKVGIMHLRTVIERMKSDAVHRGILVVQQNLTPLAKNAIDAFSSTLDLQVFLEAELLVNVKDHVLVPEHQLLTQEETKVLLEKYNVKEPKLPCIRINDPIARYYGLKRGDVVKITQLSETAGKYVTYRHVI